MREPRGAAFPPNVEALLDEISAGIRRAHLAALPEVADRERFPLRPYRVHRDLLVQTSKVRLARGAVASAAARVLSGLAWTDATPVPERVERHGLPVLRSDDHAVAWRYPLLDDDPFLYYWQPADGPSTLLRIGHVGIWDLPDARVGARPGRGPAGREDHDARGGRTGPAGLPAPITPQVAEALEGGMAGRAPVPTFTDDDLVGVLREAGGPLAVADIRTRLGVDPDVPQRRMTHAMNDALARGVVVRHGERRGARYAVAPDGSEALPSGTGGSDTDPSDG